MINMLGDLEIKVLEIMKHLIETNDKRSDFFH